jgi:predicted PurR-regulated permease PerM
MARQNSDGRHAVASATAPGTMLSATAQPTATNTVLTAILIIAALQYGQDVFLPLAIAMLITFALSPLVSILRKAGLPMIAAVLAVVALAFVLIGAFVLGVVGQIGELAQALPTFQDNIVAKLAALQGSGSENGLVSRLTQMVATINAEMAQAVPQNGGGTAGPITVEVVERRGAFATLQNIVLPLLGPIATAGLVVVVVVFMLLERDELRDRFIRLVGTNDINRTTQVIEEAGTRVGTYLLIQLLVNVIYAVPIGVGLWIIGVPNAMLWGMLTLVLRFVPYIGPVLSAIFPLFLAFAVSPDWSMVLWTAALFGVVEFISSNVIEPWLYGSRTGVSPLAIIVAAIFWTWVWGPLGLVLSTPLTVCLVVVGRHIPQFKVFDVLFGDSPVLAPHSRLYQRLLVGDTVESTLRAEELLEEEFITDYHRDVGIPALLMAQSDYERGVLSPDQQTRFSDTASHLLGELDAVVADELAVTRSAPPEDQQVLASDHIAAALPGAAFRLAVLGGRTQLDDMAARMFGQAAATEGADVLVLSHLDLTPSRFAKVTASLADCVILSFLDTAPSRASLLHIPRLKRAAPGMRVGVILWQSGGENQDVRNMRRASPEKLAEITEIGADFCATSMDDALLHAFKTDPARAAVQPTKRPRGAEKHRARVSLPTLAVVAN